MTQASACPVRCQGVAWSSYSIRRLVVPSKCIGISKRLGIRQQAPARGLDTYWFQHQQRSRVIRRTSEHWWEDEEEFDAITEMVLPKRLHVAVVAAPQEGPSGAAAAGASWAVLSSAAASELSAAAGGRFACGFASTKTKPPADALWQQLKQDGPPFFKKVRTRSCLDVLEDPAASADRVAAAAEELWSEMCGQTWRVELDYGLAGSETEPRDQLLVACQGLAAERLLSHAGLVADEATRRTGFALVDVEGSSCSSGGSEKAVGDGRDGSAAERSWRDLRPQLRSPMPSPAECRS